MVAIVLAMSTFRTTSKINLGSKIFTVHLMLVNVIHLVCDLFVNMTYVVDYDVVETVVDHFLGPGYTDHIRQFVRFLFAFIFLIFNCSMVPMMTMSILACYRPNSFTGKTAAKYFSVLIICSGT